MQSGTLRYAKRHFTVCKAALYGMQSGTFLCEKYRFFAAKATTGVAKACGSPFFFVFLAIIPHEFFTD
jgi:hypothetical protein